MTPVQAEPVGRSAMTISLARLTPRLQVVFSRAVENSTLQVLLNTNQTLLLKDDVLRSVDGAAVGSLCAHASLPLPNADLSAVRARAAP